MDEPAIAPVAGEQQRYWTAAVQRQPMAVAQLPNARFRATEGLHATTLRVELVDQGCAIAISDKQRTIRRGHDGCRSEVFAPGVEFALRGPIERPYQPPFQG